MSDLHLGSQSNHMIGRLLLFLEGLRADRLYLIGDIVNGKKENIPVEVIRALRAVSDDATYVYGNHDFLGAFGGMVSVDHTFHVTVDGRRLLVSHGDKWDPLMSGWKVALHALQWNVLNRYVHRNFVSAARRAALDQGCQGVVCGHLHHPEIHQMQGFLYVNVGDFVRAGTAVAEHADGRFELLHG
jgi:UDP-2,3-diacylglucosamine pyrophosphatase LpxH